MAYFIFLWNVFILDNIHLWTLNFLLMFHILFMYILLFVSFASYCFNISVWTPLVVIGCKYILIVILFILKKPLFEAKTSKKFYSNKFLTSKYFSFLLHHNHYSDCEIQMIRLFLITTTITRITEKIIYFINFSYFSQEFCINVYSQFYSLLPRYNN